MKKYLMATTATAVAMSAPAYASSYVTGFGGINMLDNESAQLHVPLLTTMYSASYLSTDGYLTPTESLIFVTTKSAQITKWATKSLAVDFYGEYDFDNGFVIGAALGCDIDAIPGLSVEGELAYRKNDLDMKGDAILSIQYRKYVAYHDLLSTKNITMTYQAQYGVHINTTELTGSTLYFSETTQYLSTLFGDLGSGDITAFSIMANVWYEFAGSGPIKPYIGGGVGWAKVELDIGGGVSADDSGMAWQLGAGVSYDLSDTTSLRIEYRRFQVNGLDMVASGIDLGFEDYEANDVIVGIKVNF